MIHHTTEAEARARGSLLCLFHPLDIASSCYCLVLVIRFVLPLCYLYVFDYFELETKNLDSINEF